VGPIETSCRCQSQPVSWLTLELFHAGDLPEGERRHVETHLSECACCRSCLERIETDERQLPELPAVPARPERPKWWRRRAARLGLAAAVASAAAVLLLSVLLRPPRPPRNVPGAVPPSRIAGYKGGDLALALARERRGETQLHPTRFAPGDRFKALVTCPPTRPPLHGEVVVYQDGGASFPLATASPLACGNQLPLPGAFTLTGRSPAVVCLVVGTSAPDRRRIRKGPTRLGAGLDIVCVELTPAQ
jgi:hypothetical protein